MREAGWTAALCLAIGLAAAAVAAAVVARDIARADAGLTRGAEAAQRCEALLGEDIQRFRHCFEHGSHDAARAARRPGADGEPYMLRGYLMQHWIATDLAARMDIEGADELRGHLRDRIEREGMAAGWAAFCRARGLDCRALIARWNEQPWRRLHAQPGGAPRNNPIHRRGPAAVDNRMHRPDVGGTGRARNARARIPNQPIDRSLT